MLPPIENTSIMKREVSTGIKTSRMKSLHVDTTKSINDISIKDLEISNKKTAESGYTDPKENSPVIRKQSFGNNGLPMSQPASNRDNPPSGFNKMALGV